MGATVTLLRTEVVQIKGGERQTVKRRRAKERERGLWFYILAGLIFLYS